jgi:hypothetical protein
MVRQASSHSGQNHAACFSPSAICLENSFFDCLEDRPGTVPNTQLGENIGDVILDGPLREVERAGNLAIAVPPVIRRMISASRAVSASLLYPLSEAEVLLVIHEAAAQ